MVFTQGCNFRCPFCHNGQLLDRGPGQIDTSEVLERLAARIAVMPAVTISGGEPTIHPELAGFCARLKSAGHRVKLDTNGSRPEVVRELLSFGLLDFVAMDVKAPRSKYSDLAGVAVSAQAVEESVALLAASGMPHHFRTTLVPALLTEQDIDEIRRTLPAASEHITQAFQPEHALDPALR